MLRQLRLRARRRGATLSPPHSTRRVSTSLWVLCLLLLLAAGLPGVAQPGSGDTPEAWLILREPGLELLYQTGHESVARRAARAATAAIWRISSELGSEPDQPLMLVIHPTHQAFARAVGSRRGQMIVGIASGERAVAHIDGSGALADLDEVIAHEVAHLLLAQAVGGARVPRWFDEGYAEHACGSLEWASRELLADHLEMGRLASLDELSDSFPRDGQAAAVAYAQSHALVAYLLREAPAGALPELARRLRAGEKFENAVIAATGMSVSAWDEAWRRDFHGPSRWYPWIAFLAGASGIAMSVLCLLAYRAIRRRIEALDEEDEYDRPISIRRARRWRRR